MFLLVSLFLLFVSKRRHTTKLEFYGRVPKSEINPNSSHVFLDTIYMYIFILSPLKGPNKPF